MIDQKAEQPATLSAIDAFKYWLEHVELNGSFYIVGNLEVGKSISKQIAQNIAATPAEADFLLVLDDEYQIDLTNMQDKTMLLACDQYNNTDISMNEICNKSLSARHISCAGNVMFFGKPWPFFEGYLETQRK